MKDIVDNELTTREILEKLFDELEPENPFLRKKHEKSESFRFI